MNKTTKRRRAMWKRWRWVTWWITKQCEKEEGYQQDQHQDDCKKEDNLNSFMVGVPKGND
jgi:hypothetical protein